MTTFIAFIIGCFCFRQRARVRRLRRELTEAQAKCDGYCVNECTLERRIADLEAERDELRRRLERGDSPRMPWSARKPIYN
jgi:hypothetical protein